MRGFARSLLLAALAAIPLTVVMACAPAMTRTIDRPPSSQEMAQLWTAPANLRSQDLYYGAGGRASAPAPTRKFRVLKFDGSGNSIGYTVEDAQGRKWKAKLGEEVQPEIVASRLLWAVGFHQPAMHYVGNFHLDGGRPEDSGQPARLRDEHTYKTERDWSWHDNPFVGTRQLNGLLVANLILNNWDLKTSQNRIYVMKAGHRTRGPSRRFVVQDLGAALGKTGWPTGNRNDIDGFERQNLIRRVIDGRVEFDYDARHTELFEGITPADVVWTCRLFAQLTDRQWQDAFRAANYPAELSGRFVAKLKSKVQEGLALGTRATAR
jgi:hypothetical protein